MAPRIAASCSPRSRLNRLPACPRSTSAAHPTAALAPNHRGILGSYRFRELALSIDVPEMEPDVVGRRSGSVRNVSVRAGQPHYPSSPTRTEDRVPCPVCHTQSMVAWTMPTVSSDTLCAAPRASAGKSPRSFTFCFILSWRLVSAAVICSASTSGHRRQGRSVEYRPHSHRKAP